MESNAPTLEISGYAKIHLPPELVTIEAAFSEKADRPEEALVRVARRVQKYLESIKSTGLKDLETRTTSPGVEESIRHTLDDERQHLGYSAYQTIYAITAHDPVSFGVLTRAIVDSATAPEISATFALKNPASVGPKLMALAVQDARQKADAIAVACGHRVLGLQEARDTSGPRTKPRDRGSRSSVAQPGVLYSKGSQSPDDDDSSQTVFHSQPRDLVFEEVLHCTFAMAW